MKNLNELIETADIHVKRINTAVKKLEKLFPLNVEKLSAVDDEILAWLDFLIYRFGKLQDLIGSKLIDAFFGLYKEPVTSLTMLDKLNRLEKLGLIKTDLWMKMREARNHVSHEYPNEPALTAYYLNQFYDLTFLLIEFYNIIKQKIDDIKTI